MEICEEKKYNEKKGYQHPTVLEGHLYLNKGNRELYIAIKLSRDKKIVLGGVKHGLAWNSDDPFGNDFGKWNEWEDVTNQYCLTKKE